jgi:hypothetical protein
MLHQSLSSTEDRIKRNIRYSQPSLHCIEKHVCYSRHLSFQHQSTSSNGRSRSRLVIHASIQSPKTDRRRINPNQDLHSVRFF